MDFIHFVIQLTGSVFVAVLFSIALYLLKDSLTHALAINLMKLQSEENKRLQEGQVIFAKKMERLAEHTAILFGMICDVEERLTTLGSSKDKAELSGKLPAFNEAWNDLLRQFRKSRIYFDTTICDDLGKIIADIDMFSTSLIHAYNLMDTVGGRYADKVEENQKERAELNARLVAMENTLRALFWKDDKR